jgi:hypothetical protein
VETEDFGRSPVVKTDHLILGARPPNQKGAIENVEIAEANLLPREAKGHAGSKVTWQEFIDWMNTRNV